MARFRLLRAALAFGLLVMTACSIAAADTLVSSKNHPNVLIIITDDQRPDATLVEMPNVRRWFKKTGTEFTNTFSTTPLCCPARASLMSGLYAHNHGVTKNSEGDELPQRTTIQRVLHDMGYITGITGKFLNGWRLDRAPAHFDRWAIQRWGYNNAEFNVNGFITDQTGYSTDFVTQMSLQFLDDYETADDRPWYLYVSPFAAHKPQDAAPQYEDSKIAPWYGNPATREKRTGDKLPYRARRMTKQDGKALRRRQLRTLKSVDDGVGAIFQRLYQLGELDNTLAFFISDNGISWGEHGLQGKRLPYTESVRIPMFMRWRNHVARGGVDRRLVTNLDVAPTIYNATRANPRYRLDGRSLLRRKWKRRLLLLEHWGRRGTRVPTWTSIRTRDWQYVEYETTRGRVFWRDYYNLKRDRWQLRNLLGDDKRKNNPSKDRLKAVESLLARLRNCSASRCP